MVATLLQDILLQLTHTEPKATRQVLIPATTTTLQNISSLTPAGQGTKSLGLLLYISIATKRLKQAHHPGSGSFHFYVPNWFCHCI